MSLRLKAILIIAVAFALLVPVVSWVTSRRLMDGFLRAEEAEARTTVERVLRTVDRTIFNLDTRVRALAESEGVRRAVRTNAAAPLSAPVDDKLLESLRLNLLLLVDANGVVRWSAGHDLEPDKAREVDSSTAARLAAMVASSSIVERADGSRCGVMTLPPLPESDTEEHGPGVQARAAVVEGPVLFAARPVQESEDDTWTLIAARYLDREEIRRIGVQTVTDLDARARSECTPDGGFADALGQLLQGRGILVRQDDDSHCSAYAAIGDADGRPAVVFRTRILRSIHDEGKRSTRYLLLHVLGVAVVFATASLLLLNRGVLLPLRRLTDGVRRIADDNICSRRLAAHGNGEVADLGRAINSFLDRLQLSRIEIVESEERFRMLADTAPVMVWVAAPDTACMFVNKTWLDYCGRPMEAELGQGWADGLHPDDRGRVLREIQSAFDQRRPFSIERRHRRADGEYRWFIDTGVPRFRSDGEFAGFTGTCLDITERRHSQQELEAARQAAEAASRAKSEFLANLSHEIRTPMTSILGYADLVMDEGLTREKRAEYARTIGTSGRHLLHILNDILDYSKIEAGGITVEPAPCDPEQVIADAVAMVRDSARARGLELTADARGLARPGAPRAMLDSTRLRQVLVNLLSNAIKFTERGSVRLEARLDQDDGEERLVVSVSDTGIGMTEEQIGRLFRPFAQVDTSTSRRFGGTGLGLAISHRLAELMGGTLRVLSTPGEGSRFTLRVPMPRSTPHADAALNADARATADGDRPLARRRVLLAEDCDANRRLIEHVLRRAGAEVTIVGDGVAAVEAAIAAEPAGARFEVILLDLQMPALDGYGAITRLRDQLPHTPVLALTANAQAQDRERCLAAGFDDYLTKPIDGPRLVAACAAWCRSGRISQARSGINAG